MMDHSEFGYLAWFLGPKAENGKLFEALVTDIVRDYSHWRRNYFPDDPILLTHRLRDEQKEDQSILESRLADLLAALRRNFPFYSPRYIAHELSDTLMPAVLGYMAGLLYNPNNVTPEAAPVTTELEVEVASEILKMVGFHAPPELPSKDVDPASYYTERARTEYGWAHLTSGGTVANIEALWVARQVKYFPLSVKHLATKLKLDIQIKLPNGQPRAIADIDDYSLLMIRPNESVYLLDKLVKVLRQRELLTDEVNPMGQAWSILEGSPFAITKGLAAAFERFPPKILVASSRHYSIAKAANILGIGQSNIVPIRMNQDFRMDVDHLRAVLLNEVYYNQQVPLCVIASAGTTEEGAVDPIHEIADLRRELETSHGMSFWLHIDAAWGGYIRSLFALDEQDKTEALCGYISRSLPIERPSHQGFADRTELQKWHDRMASFLLARIDRVEANVVAVSIVASTAERSIETPDAPIESITESRVKDPSLPGDPKTPSSAEPKSFRTFIEDALEELSGMLSRGEFQGYRKRLRQFLFRFVDKPQEYLPGLEECLRGMSEDGSNFRIIADWVRDYVGERLVLERPLQFNWPTNDVAKAFLGFPRADSITVDPHKLGYAPYAAGSVAFRNDLVRSFVLQEAPYITSAEHGKPVHVPPRYAKQEGDHRRIVMESFSPFILEGSRAGATAAGLWLAMKCVPYNPRGHGAIVRASLLSAKLLHEKLQRYGSSRVTAEQGNPVKFIPLLANGPDTNLVTFTIAPRVFTSLRIMNELTENVYDTFSIQAELGEREHSYSQPFFLSKTRLRHDHYPLVMLKPFLERAGLLGPVGPDYQRFGLVVLRATVMSPYLVAARTVVNQDFCDLFLMELIRSAESAFRTIVGNCADRD